MSPEPQSPNPPIDPNDPTQEEGQPFVMTLPDDPASGQDWYLWAAVLALIVLVAFWPAISGTFLWDDEQYVTQNHALLDAAGLLQIWKIPPGTIQYYPLTFTMLWIEHHFWENNSLGYRLVNLLLHAGAAVLLWRILRRLSVPGAWAAAAIWAIHPLQAESVCWISESKNVLSGILALVSTLFYLEFVAMRDPDSTRKIWDLKDDWQIYAISLGFFLLAMLSKTVVCFLPAALLIILWWKRRISVRAILGLVPMLVIGAALAWETSRLETNPNGPVGASGPGWQLSFAPAAPDRGQGLVVLRRQTARANSPVVRLSAASSEPGRRRRVAPDCSGGARPRGAGAGHQETGPRPADRGAVLHRGPLSRAGIFQRVSIPLFLRGRSLPIPRGDSADRAGGLDRIANPGAAVETACGLPGPAGGRQIGAGRRADYRRSAGARARLRGSARRSLPTP